MDPSYNEEVRKALQFSVGEILRVEHAKQQEKHEKEQRQQQDQGGKEAPIPFGGGATSTLTHLLLKYTAILADDLHQFSKHGKRSVVGVDDVKLVARRGGNGVTHALASFEERRKKDSASGGGDTRGSKKKVKTVAAAAAAAGGVSFSLPVDGVAHGGGEDGSGDDEYNGGEARGNGDENGGHGHRGRSDEDDFENSPPNYAAVGMRGGTAGGCVLGGPAAPAEASHLPAVPASSGGRRTWELGAGSDDDDDDDDESSDDDLLL